MIFTTILSLSLLLFAPGRFARLRSRDCARRWLLLNRDRWRLLNSNAAQQLKPLATTIHLDQWASTPTSNQCTMDQTLHRERLRERHRCRHRPEVAHQHQARPQTPTSAHLLQPAWYHHTPKASKSQHTCNTSNPSPSSLTAFRWSTLTSQPRSRRPTSSPASCQPLSAALSHQPSLSMATKSNSIRLNFLEHFFFADRRWFSMNKNKKKAKAYSTAYRNGIGHGRRLDDGSNYTTTCLNLAGQSKETRRRRGNRLLVLTLMTIETALYHLLGVCMAWRLIETKLQKLAKRGIRV